MPSNQTPLNTFRTLAYKIPAVELSLDAVPAGITRIILGAQASNPSTATISVTFTLRKNSIDYLILKDYQIPPNDAADLIAGKLILEQGCSLKIQASVDNVSDLILSVLDTSNE
jgi:hypothetical protein